MLQRTEFLLGELLTNLRRNGLLTLAAVITVMCSLVVFGLFNLANTNLQNILLEEARKAQISAFLVKDLKSDDREKLEKAIRELPEVRDVAYVSSKEAFERLRKDMDSPVLDSLGDEADGRLPAKFSVTPRDSGTIDALAKQLKSMAGVSDVSYGGQVVRLLNDLLKQVRLAGYLAMFLLALATCAIISNAIRLTIYARRREIRIMQLVGATDWFVRVPFMLEGLFHGVVGGLLAVIVTFALYRHMAHAAESLLPFLKLVKPEALRASYTLGLSALGALIGIGSSLISMRQFLKEA